VANKKTDESIYSQGDTTYAGGVPIGKVGTAVANNGGAGSNTPTGGSPSGGGSAADPDAGLSMDAYRAKYGVPTGGGGSSGGYYRSTGAKQPDRTGYLRSAKELGKLFDINYDMDAIRKIYDDATDAKYNVLSKELQQGENTFYSNQANANATLLDTLRKATSSAIATGASRGIASAEQLGLMMEQQQSIVDEATQLAQERANMADKIAQEKAENIVNALQYSDELKKSLAGVSSNVYSADAQYDVGLLDFYSKLKEVEAALYNTDAQKEINANQLEENRRQFDLGDLLERDKMKQADQQFYDQLDYNKWATEGGWQNALDAARIQAAAYARGGYGGNGNNDTEEGDDWNKIWNSGNYEQALKYWQDLGFSPQQAEARIRSDEGFMLNWRYGGYDNVPSALKGNTTIQVITDKTANEIAQKAQKKNVGSNSSANKEVYQIVSEKDGSKTVWYRDGSYAIIPPDLTEQNKTKQKIEQYLKPTQLTYKK